MLAAALTSCLIALFLMRLRTRRLRVYIARLEKANEVLNRQILQGPTVTMRVIQPPGGERVLS